MAISLSHHDSVNFPRRDGHDDFLPEAFPAIYIDYIGVQRSCQREKIGSTLLIHALRIGYEVNKVVPLYAVALRSLNDDTTRLYAKYGFVKLPNSGNPPLMVLPIWSVIDLFSPRSN
jgi:GNAT superfamily N-acetyltransferase